MLEESVFHGREDFAGFIKYIKDKRYNNVEFSKYCSIFTFTTENLDSYLKELDVYNKRVLTITSSGDQLINLALLNVNFIDCFDINRLCYYYTMLKLTGLMFLDYEEFISYFTYCEDSVFIADTMYPLNINEYRYDYNIYTKIREKLDIDVQLLFDELYATYEYSGEAISRSKLFNSVPMTSAKYNNTYLASCENYYKAREQVKKLIEKYRIKFYNLDFFQLHELDKQYDIVLLSNIYDYIPVPDKNLFVEYIKQQMNNILADNCIVIVEYQYCGDKRENGNEIINNLAINVDTIRDTKYVLSEDIKLLDELNLSLIKVPSIYKAHRENNMEDCVYVYQKGNYRRYI